MSSDSSQAEPIAIVGMAAVYPGADDLGQYWANIVGGVDSIGDVPPGRIDPVYFEPGPAAADRFTCRRGGFIDGQAVLDPAGLGIVPATVDSAEPDQLLCLSLASAALGDAGLVSGEYPSSTTGVVVGRGGYLTPGLARLDQRVRTAVQVVETIREIIPGLDAEQLSSIKRAFVDALGPERADAAIDLVPNFSASRIANRMDLGGPAYTVDAACASSLVAVDQAMGFLRSRQCDLMLVGGVHLCHDPTFWSVFNQLGALSSTGEIRPFDRRADGLVIGEGGAMLVLQRLADAREAGARTYAVVRGSGISSDGRSAGLMRPGLDGQVLALERAWSDAGIDRDQIGLVEAHGTATPVGDATEMGTLAKFFGPRSVAEPAVIGSVKSMIGHTMPAAGAAGLVKAALAVYHGIFPPTLHCEEPSPLLSETRFDPLSRSKPWDLPPERRVAAVNAFGFGGINGHLVLTGEGQVSIGTRPVGRRGSIGTVGVGERGADGAVRGAVGVGERGADGAGVPARPARPELERVLLVGGRDQHEVLAKLDDAQYRDPASVVGFPTEGPMRLVLVAPDDERMVLARRVVERGRPMRGRRDVWFAPEGVVNGDHKTAFVFPGVERTFEPHVDDVAEVFGFPSPPQFAPGPATNDLEVLGRAMVATGRLLHGAVGRLGLKADMMAGQSLGEWSAMMATETMIPALVDGFMASLPIGSLEVPGLVFIAMGTDIETTARLMDGLPGMAISHDNAPHQTIVCGPQEQAETLVERARDSKVLGEILPFRSGFHTPMFEPYLEPVIEAMGRMPIQLPRVPMWSATTCEPYPNDVEAIRALQIEHLLKPVRFRELMERFHQEGVRLFVQIGVGTLPGLIEDTLGSRPGVALSVNSSKRGGTAQLIRAVTSCWAEGVDGLTLAPLAGGQSVAQSIATGIASRPRRSLALQAPLVHLSANRISSLEAVPAASGRLDGLVAMESSSALGHELNALMAEVVSSSAILAEAFAPGSAATVPLLLRTPRQDVPGEGDDLFGQAGDAEFTWRSRHGQATRGALGAADRAHSRDVGAASSDDGAAGSVSPTLGSISRTFTFSVENEPSYADHCLYRQHPGSASLNDLYPIVPITGMVELMMQMADALYPDLVPVAVEDMRAMRWLAVSPPVQIEIRLQELEAESGGGSTRRVKVSLESYARAVVVLEPRYPDPPEVVLGELVEPGEPATTADRLYEDRWMFHGPAYQGVKEIGPMAANGVDGVLVARSAPGALMDNAGQLMGLWVMASQPYDLLALPSSIDRIRFYGPNPEPGELFDASVRITAVEDRYVRADMKLVNGGRTWALVDGWCNFRFETDDEIWAVYRWPEKAVLSLAQEGGWFFSPERWQTAASRELMMRRYLSEPERSQYHRLNPRAQRHYLLGRIAAKDAARQWLWDHGAGPLWPVEIVVSNTDTGQPVLSVPGGHDIRVSIAHSSWCGVAIVGDGVDVGIDVEVVEPRAAHFMDLTYSVSELSIVLDGISDEDRDDWLTRGWAAKEAFAKASGTGLQGRPRDFVIEECDGEVLVVNGRRVHTTCMDEFVVAWTMFDEPAEVPM